MWKAPLFIWNSKSLMFWPITFSHCTKYLKNMWMRPIMSHKFKLYIILIISFKYLWMTLFWCSWHYNQVINQKCFLQKSHVTYTYILYHLLNNTLKTHWDTISLKFQAFFWQDVNTLIKSQVITLLLDLILSAKMYKGR